MEGRVSLTLATTRVPYAHFNNYDENVFSQPQSSVISHIILIYLLIINRYHLLDHLVIEEQ